MTKRETRTYIEQEIEAVEALILRMDFDGNPYSEEVYEVLLSLNALLAALEGK